VQDISDILKMFWNLKEPIQLIISLITLYLIIWFNKIPKVKDREELLRNRLMEGGVFRPGLKTNLGTFLIYMVQMRESRGYKYWMKKLFLWKVEGHTTIYMHSDTLYSSVENQLPEVKKAVEKECNIRTRFFKSKDRYLGMFLEIPSTDPDKCMDILLEVGDILKSESR